MKHLFQQTSSVSARYMFRADVSNDVDFSRLQNIESYEGLEAGILRQRIETALELVEHSIPNEAIDGAVDEAEKNILEIIYTDLEKNVLEKHMGVSKADIEKKMKTLSSDAEQKKEEWKQYFQEKKDQFQSKVDTHNGIMPALTAEIDQAKSSTQNSIRSVILESLQEDLDIKTNGVQPKSWIEYQAQLMYDTMDTTTKALYLLYIGEKKLTHLPGRVYSAGRDAWTDVGDFLSDTLTSIGDGWNNISNSVSDFFTDTDPVADPRTLTTSEQSFWNTLQSLPEKMMDRMRTYSPEVLSYFEENFKELGPAITSYQGADWFDPRYAVPGALTGMYLSTYIIDSGAEGGGGATMLKTSALFAGLASVPKVTVPLLNTTTALAKGTARVTGDALGIGWNAGMSFVRDTGDFGVLTNPKFALDGKWESTRQQEKIKESLDALDTKTAEYVPPIIETPYQKLVNNKIEQVTDTEISSLADFCVKSLDKGTYLSPEEFARIQLSLSQTGGKKWEDLPQKDLLRMLNTAYQKRIMLSFLLLPDTHKHKEKFKSVFTQKLAERKKDEWRHALSSQDRLQLQELYKDKIDLEHINVHQRKGVYGDVFQNKNALATLGIPIALLYMFVHSIVGMKNFVAKQKEKSAQKKLEKMRDAMTTKGQKKISDLVSTGVSKKALLSVLVAENILTQSDKKQLDDIDEDDFKDAIANGQFRHNIASDLSTVSQSFWDDMAVVKDQVPEFEALQSKSKQFAQMERLRRKFERGESVPKMECKAGADNLELYDLNRNMTDSLRQGWENFRLPGMKKEKSFVFHARKDDKTYRYALVEKEEGVFLCQLKGRDQDFSIDKNVPLEVLQF